MGSRHRRTNAPNTAAATIFRIQEKQQLYHLDSYQNESEESKSSPSKVGGLVENVEENVVLTKNSQNSEATGKVL